MTRSDYLTLGIVGVCLAALVFLIFRFSRIHEDTAVQLPAEQNAPFAPEEEYLPDTLDDPYAYSDTLEGKAVDVDPYAPVAPAAEEPVEKIKPANVSPAADSKVGNYLVLAGSFRFKVHAEQEVRRLHKKGYQQAALSLFNRGAFATVLVDRFDSYNEADVLVTQLRKDGIEAYVHRKRVQ